MHCRSVEQRMQKMLDDRLDPSVDSDLIEHASMCDECRELLEGQRTFVDGLQLPPIPTLSADFSDRVVGTLMSRQRRSARRFAPAAAFLAIVATLLLVVALGPRTHKTIGPEDDRNVVASAEPNDVRALMADFDSLEVRVAIEQFVAQLTSGEGAGFYQVDQIAGTIRPLTSTLNVAFYAIRRSIPGRRHPSSGEPQAIDLRHPWTLRVI